MADEITPEKLLYNVIEKLSDATSRQNSGSFLHKETPNSVTSKFSKLFGCQKPVHHILLLTCYCGGTRSQQVSYAGSLQFGCSLNGLITIFFNSSGLLWLLKKLNETLSAPIEALLDSADDDTWPSINKLLQWESEKVVSGFSTALTVFDIDEEEKDKMISGLKDHARGVIEGKAKEEAERVIIRMKDGFTTLFRHDSDSMPLVWTGNEDIRAITKAARSASLKLLSVMAAIHLDDVADNIESTLELALADTKAASIALKNQTKGRKK